MEHRISTLDNGIRVVTTRRPSRMTTAVRVYIRAGSRYDGEHPGSAHFVEHALFSGTKTRSSGQIFGDIESLGGVIQANTTKEYTNLSSLIMDRYMENALDVLADVISNPAFDPMTFLREKLVIAEEIKRSQDAQGVLWDLFSKTLWTKNPIRWPVLGDMESLRDMEYEDVVHFYHKRYTGTNIVVSICGDMDHDHAVEQVSQRFSDIQSGVELHPTPVTEPSPSKRTAHLEKDIHQTHLIMGVLAAGMKDEDRYSVKLMDRIVGSGACSRLYRRLRDQEKKVYSIYSVAAMYEDTGCLAVRTSCSPENVTAVESIIVEEWEKMRSEPVSDEELETAKRIYEGTLMRQYETNMYVAGIYGIEALLHEIEPFDQAIERISAVTKEDILEASRFYMAASGYAMVTVGRSQRE